MRLTKFFEYRRYLICLRIWVSLKFIRLSLYCSFRFYFSAFRITIPNFLRPEMRVILFDLILSFFPNLSQFCQKVILKYLLVIIFPVRFTSLIFREIYVVNHLRKSLFRFSFAYFYISWFRWKLKTKSNRFCQKKEIAYFSTNNLLS